MSVEQYYNSAKAEQKRTGSRTHLIDMLANAVHATHTYNARYAAYSSQQHEAALKAFTKKIIADYCRECLAGTGKNPYLMHLNKQQEQALCQALDYALNQGPEVFWTDGAEQVILGTARQIRQQQSAQQQYHAPAAQSPAPQQQYHAPAAQSSAPQQQYHTPAAQTNGTEQLAKTIHKLGRPKNKEEAIARASQAIAETVRQNTGNKGYTPPYIEIRTCLTLYEQQHAISITTLTDQCLGEICSTFATQLATQGTQGLDFQQWVKNSWPQPQQLVAGPAPRPRPQPKNNTRNNQQHYEAASSALRKDRNQQQQQQYEPASSTLTLRGGGNEQSSKTAPHPTKYPKGRDAIFDRLSTVQPPQQSLQNVLASLDNAVGAKHSGYQNNTVKADYHAFVTEAANRFCTLMHAKDFSELTPEQAKGFHNGILLAFEQNILQPYAPRSNSYQGYKGTDPLDRTVGLALECIPDNTLTELLEATGVGDDDDLLAQIAAIEAAPDTAKATSTTYGKTPTFSGDIFTKYDRDFESKKANAQLQGTGGNALSTYLITTNKANAMLEQLAYIRENNTNTPKLHAQLQQRENAILGIGNMPPDAAQKRRHHKLCEVSATALITAAIEHTGETLTPEQKEALVQTTTKLMAEHFPGKKITEISHQPLEKETGLLNAAKNAVRQTADKTPQLQVNQSLQNNFGRACDFRKTEAHQTATKTPQAKKMTRNVGAHQAARRGNRQPLPRRPDKADNDRNR